jgi:hypothetical protein
VNFNYIHEALAHSKISLGGLPQQSPTLTRFLIAQTLEISTLEDKCMWFSKDHKMQFSAMKKLGFSKKIFLLFWPLQGCYCRSFSQNPLV